MTGRTEETRLRFTLADKLSNVIQPKSIGTNSGNPALYLYGLITDVCKRAETGRQQMLPFIGSCQNNSGIVQREMCQSVTGGPYR